MYSTRIVSNAYTCYIALVVALSVNYIFVFHQCLYCMLVSFIESQEI